MRTLFLALLLTSATANAANIYVVDGGILPAYLPQLSDRLLKESCYSVFDLRLGPYPTDSNNTQYSHYYQYKQASLCQNKSSEMHEAGATTLRMHDLPGAIGKNGHPDVSVAVVQDDHQTIIADVIKANTSAGVRQWHVMHQYLVGIDALGKIDYVNYNVLDQLGGVTPIIRALEHLTDGFFSLNGVEVVSLSEHLPKSGTEINDRYTWPCDTHSDVLNNDLLIDYAGAIRKLKEKGVTVVTATANSIRYPSDDGDRTQDNYKMPFPACLSTTVAVGGLSNQGFAQGAVSPGTDFITNFHHPHPLNGGDETGTSLSTPKVASYLVELLTVNPLLSGDQALTALRSTANFHNGFREYDNGTIRINYSIAVPDFDAAKNSIVDNFWKDLVPVLLGQTDDTKYGWNYGTSIHENGVLSYFDTVTLPKTSPKTAVSTDDPVSATQNAQSGEPVLRYSFRPYDIDSADEVQVLVNDKAYGYVAPTGSNVLRPTQTFCISASDLTANGADNEVKLKLKTARETWGVTNLKIQTGIRDASCKEDDGGGTGTDETVTLTLGVSDTKQYGQNYGRDGNTSQLDVMFTPLAGQNHTVSWTPYDIETGEMDVFLNDTLVKTVPSTSNNSLGAGDTLTIPASNLVSGTNTLSFRVTGSDGTWGVTNLLAQTVIDAGTGEPESRTLLEAPEERSFIDGIKRYDYPFSFSPRGTYYRETIDIGFDAYLKHGTLNGFAVQLNGQTVGSIPTYEGRATTLRHTVSLDKSRLRTGSNTVTIWVTSNAVVYNLETKISNVQVVAHSIPLLNVAVSRVSLPSNTPVNNAFDATAVIVNVGAKTSAANTLHFYVSETSNLSNPIAVGSKTIGSLAGQSSRSEIVSIDSPHAITDSFFWACLGRVSEDVNIADDCSPAIELKLGASIMPAIMLLLLD